MIPVIGGLAADQAGRIWIERRDAAEPLIDVVTADGRYLGTLRNERLPQAFGPDGLAAWVVEDDHGVPRVSVGRVRLSGS